MIGGNKDGAQKTTLFVAAVVVVTSHRITRVDKTAHLLGRASKLISFFLSGRAQTPSGRCMRLWKHSKTRPFRCVCPPSSRENRLGSHHRGGVTSRATVCMRHVRWLMAIIYGSPSSPRVVKRKPNVDFFGRFFVHFR